MRLTTREIRAAALLCLLTPTIGAAQADGPPTRRTKEIIALINDGTPGAISAYVDSAFGGRMRGMPLSAHLGFMLGQRATGADSTGPRRSRAPPPRRPPSSRSG